MQLNKREIAICGGMNIFGLNTCEGMNVRGGVCILVNG